MPATVNLLGRAAALPTPKGSTGLAVLPELGYALFEIGEVEEASTLLADAQARARTDGDRHVEWRVDRHAPAHRDVPGPRGDRPGRPRRRDGGGDRHARRARGRGRAGQSVDGSLRPPLERWSPSRGERHGDPGRGVRPPCRQSARGRVGPRPERAVRHLRSDAGPGGSALARAVAPSRAGEPHPRREPGGVRHRARGDERSHRRGPRAHRGEPRPRAGPRNEVAGCRPGAPQRLCRVDGGRPRGRRGRYAKGRAGLPRDRRGMVPVHRRGRSAARRLRAGALRRRLRPARRHR